MIVDVVDRFCRLPVSLRCCANGKVETILAVLEEEETFLYTDYMLDTFI